MVTLGVILAILGAIIDASGLLTAGVTLVVIGLIVNLGWKRRVW